MNKKTKQFPILLSVLVLFALVLSACQVIEEPVVDPPPADEIAEEPEVLVPDEEDLDPEIVGPTHEIAGDPVNIVQVYSDGPGLVVIHADDNGQPGPVIGYTAIPDGLSTDVVVDVDQEAVTETLHAMLHVDAEETGELDFPGPDEPVTVDGEVVNVPFDGTPGG